MNADVARLGRMVKSEHLNGRAVVNDIDPRLRE
jgi:hypothetical protein